MPPKREAMGARPDGRLYSRIMRRCVALIQHTKRARNFDLIEIAREVQKKEYPEFQTRRGNQFVQVKADRIRAYLSYLVDLRIIQPSESQYSLNFAKPSKDSVWAQSLSDIAKEHLSKLLDKEPLELERHLETIRTQFHEEGKVPTIAAIVAEAGLDGTRQEEVFRWSLYLYADGDACPYELRQYPHLMRKD